MQSLRKYGWLNFMKYKNDTHVPAALQKLLVSCSQTFSLQGAYQLGIISITPKESGTLPIHSLIPGTWSSYIYAVAITYDHYYAVVNIPGS